MDSQKRRNPSWVNDAAFAEVKKEQQKKKRKQHACERYLQTREGNDYSLCAGARNQAKNACHQSVKDLKKTKKLIAKDPRKNPKTFYT